MAEYEIKRWDAVIIKNNVQPYPMIYIKPDEAFLKFAEENHYAVLVKISGSNTIYDGKHIIGTVGNMECDRPHLQNATGYYTITLYSGWFGIPECLDKLGVAEISGLKGDEEHVIPHDEQARIVSEIVPQEAIHNNPTGDIVLATIAGGGDVKKEKLSNQQINMVVLALGVFFVFFVGMGMKK